MIGNEEQKNAGVLDKNITPNLGEGFDKQISRFDTAQGSRTHDLIKGIRVASCNQIFTEAEQKKRLEELGATSGIFTDTEFPASKESLVGNINPSNPELAK